MTSWPWKLARNCSKYSSALRQTSQNLTSAKKTRQHEVDKFMKSNKLGNSAILVEKTCQRYVANPSK